MHASMHAYMCMCAWVCVCVFVFDLTYLRVRAVCRDAGARI